MKIRDSSNQNPRQVQIKILFFSNHNRSVAIHNRSVAIQNQQLKILLYRVVINSIDYHIYDRLTG